MRSPNARLIVLMLAVLVMALPACKKEAPPAPAPQAPPPAPKAEPAPPPPAAEPPEVSDWVETEAAPQTFLSADEINRRQLLRTVYFDFDRAEIRADQRATLQANAAWLRDHGDVRILIEGHCDERGTREYNLALGDRRAQAARDYLVSLGVDGARVETISYGEERPAGEGSNEAAWSLNRRGMFVAVAPGGDSN